MKDLWFDTRLTEEEMNFLNDAISEENKKNWNHDLAGNISKSELIMDKDNWFFKSVLKKLTERMFYQDWDNYYKYHIEGNESPPEFEMDIFWVNYMKQHEFNPLHGHSGLYSFVVFMKIPTHWKEQHALPFSANSVAPLASDFAFMASEKGTNELFTSLFPLSPEDEGRMLFFPGWLQHEVYPFYECEEERVTISGNIRMYDPNRPEVLKLSNDVYEEKKKILEIMEGSVRVAKEELKMMKEGRGIKGGERIYDE